MVLLKMNSGGYLQYAGITHNRLYEITAPNILKATDEKLKLIGDRVVDIKKIIFVKKYKNNNKKA